MKRMEMKGIRYSALLIVMTMILSLSSCSGSYRDLPFGGMNGKVQKVTVWHHMPEVWRVNTQGADIMSIDALAYDIYGNEICSARMDSTGQIESEAESLFENGVCVRSVQKIGGRVIARLNLLKNDGKTLEYSKDIAGDVDRMKIKKSSFFRRHKSIVSENGKITSINTIKTDRKGRPVWIKEVNPQTGSEIIQKNTYDENNNVTEKHVITKGQDKEEVLYLSYTRLDEQGNWLEAHTYNRNHLPVEILIREIEYW